LIFNSTIIIIGGIEMSKNTFGQTIRKLRKEKQLTQKEVAKEVGIDVTYLSKIENGKLDPPAHDKIEKLAKILDVDSDFLITEAGKVPEDITNMIPKNSSKIPKLLRSGKDLSDEDWDRVQEYIDKLKRKDK